MVVTFDSTISHTLEDMKRREDWSFSLELNDASSGDGFLRLGLDADVAGVTDCFLLLTGDIVLLDILMNGILGLVACVKFGVVLVNIDCELMIGMRHEALIYNVNCTYYLRPTNDL